MGVLMTEILVALRKTAQPQPATILGLSATFWRSERNHFGSFGGCPTQPKSHSSLTPVRKVVVVCHVLEGELRLRVAVAVALRVSKGCG